MKNGGAKPANGEDLARRLSLAGMDFLRVIAKGEKHSCPACHAYFLPAEEFRSGISVSKKLGGAVVRNRIKRVLFEAVRLTRRTFGNPCHLVLVAREGAERLDLSQARKLLADLYGRSRVAAAARNA